MIRYEDLKPEMSGRFVYCEIDGKKGKALLYLHNGNWNLCQDFIAGGGKIHGRYKYSWILFPLNQNSWTIYNFFTRTIFDVQYGDIIFKAEENKKNGAWSHKRCCVFKSN